MLKFTDSKSGQIFCVAGNVTDIKDYNFIDWCQQYVTNKDTFVDIGAHIGAFTILMGINCKNVIAFEPHVETYQCLVETIKENNIKNVKLERIALYSSNTSKPLYFKEADTNSASLYRKDEDVNEIVACRMLDGYDINNVSFIKISVNGAELEVLKGAMKFIEKNHYPPMVVNVKNNRNTIEQILKELGYKIFNAYPDYILAADNEKYKEFIKNSEKTKNGEKTDDILKDQFEKEGGKSFTWDDWHRVGRYYRIQKKYHLSYVCCMAGMAMGCPKSKEYLFYEDLSMVCYYLDKIKEGYDASDKVVLSYAPWNIRNQAQGNQKYYMTQLPTKYAVELEVPCEPGYVCSSLSINREGNKLKCCIRTVNYRIIANGKYHFTNADGTTNTINYLTELDSKLKMWNIKELVDKSDMIKYHARIKGLEDVRLFGSNQFIGTNLETTKENIVHIVYGEYNDDGIVYKKVLPLIDGRRQTEKNWMPFILNGEVHFIYSCAPLLIYKLDMATGIPVLVSKKTLGNGLNFDGFRGSGGAIVYKGGWLCTVHQVWHGDNGREYYNRFVWFNEDFTEMRYGPIFYFEKPQIEFNLSICLAEDGILVPYSVNDACSKIAVVDYGVMDAWLNI